MPRVTYIEHDDSEHIVDGDVGDSVMQTAVDNSIEGIIGDCGGALSCATCHCYVDDAWMDKTGEADEMEIEMLECANDVADNSRLSCQIELTDEMDGLIVRLPEFQY